MAAPDSLDVVELVMAIEEALDADIEARIARGEFGDDDLDADALSALVRKLGPRSPRGQAGAAAKPDEA